MAVLVALAVAASSFFAESLALADARSPDLASIMARFETMDAEISNLQTQVDGMQDGVVQVEELANSVGKSIAKSISTIASASKVAGQNKASAAVLKEESTRTSEKVAAATDEMNRLQSQVNELRMTAMSLGTDSADIGARISKLEGKVQEALPGVSGITGRIDNLEESVKSYQQQVTSGQLDAPVAKGLRDSFRRASRSIEKLSEDVKKAAMADAIKEG
mmetsp:Transcript_38882/g.77151  ORF Transcript_38882/g.77151 Transcript_38882/m.77151 type:complete len:220 (+) Transcript_38882:62-721(+)